jgi:antibiotic biosynthesis monooxygenase (ABM) superfamily enzyme
LTTKLRVAGNVEMAPITEGITRVMMAGAKFPGFYSAEIIPPSITRSEWTLVERFVSYDEANSWMHSNTRKELIEALRNVVPGRILSSEEILDDKGSAGLAATAIVTYVKPGMEADYWNWESRIQAAQARFPGYRGTYIQPPPPDSPGKWTTMLRFDTADSLEQWIASSVRKELLVEAERLVNATLFQDMSSSFPGWFQADRRGQNPTTWKTALLVLVAIFPFICLFHMVISSVLSNVTGTLANLIVLALSVAMLSWGCMPLLVKLLRWWLLPDQASAGRANLLGALIMVAALAIELFLFWNLR